MLGAVSKKVDFAKPDAAARPSRIRRDPAPAEKPVSLEKALWRSSREWEIGIAIAGMVLFALGIDAACYLIAGVFTH
jgi:hypothetical protein